MPPPPRPALHPSRSVQCRGHINRVRRRACRGPSDRGKKEKKEGSRIPAGIVAPRRTSLRSLRDSDEAGRPLPRRKAIRQRERQLGLILAAALDPSPPTDRCCRYLPATVSSPGSSSGQPTVLALPIRVPPSTLPAFCHANSRHPRRGFLFFLRARSAASQFAHCRRGWLPAGCDMLMLVADATKGKPPPSLLLGSSVCVCSCSQCSENLAFFLVG